MMPPAELWRAVLELLCGHPLTAEPWGRDQARVDETLAELFLLGERPSVDSMRVAITELGASHGWTKEVAARWRKRLARPGWEPRALARGGGWVRPFYIPELVVHELGLRPIPDRLADALDTAARAYMTRSAADPASAGTSDEATIFALSAGAVRLWSLLQDAVEDMSCPSVVSTALDRKDNLVRHWTNAGRERERAKIERWRAEEDELRRRTEGESDIDN